MDRQEFIRELQRRGVEYACLDFNPDGPGGLFAAQLQMTTPLGSVLDIKARSFEALLRELPMTAEPC